MDETLLAHLNRLREIDRRLEDILCLQAAIVVRGRADDYSAWQALGNLCADLAVWIKAAEEDYEAF